MARLIGQQAMNRIISHHVEVRAAVIESAEEIAAKARALLALHRDEGHAEIQVEHAEVDSFVHLVDEAAVSIEFGHFVDNGEIDAEITYVPGLYIITRASGLA